MGFVQGAGILSQIDRERGVHVQSANLLCVERGLGVGVVSVQVVCSDRSADGGLYVELFAGGFGRLGGGVEVRVHEERVAGRLPSADDLPVAQQELAVEREPLALCLWQAPRLQHRTGEWRRASKCVIVGLS